MSDTRLPLELIPDGKDIMDFRQAAKWVWFFVVLGIAARVIRYALRFPLWEDECFLSCSLLHRGYLDLTASLDYYQVCPVGFLWLQLTMVKLLGFHEYSLRLVALVLSVASVFLFRHLAGRLLKGTPLVLAMAVFAVSYPGIRYASEGKQYCADLFVSLALSTIAVEWWRRPDQRKWLWALVAVTPLGLALSYPAVFVGGGISLFVALSLWREQRRNWLPWIAYNIVMAASFAGLFAVSARNQSAGALDMMQRCWDDGFPPLTQPLKLLVWLAEAHTSDMLAYPLGGHSGASTLTFLCCAAGAAVLWRRGERMALLLLLAPLVLTFVAAAVHRYPYGQMVKFQIYLFPAFSILAAIGGVVLGSRFSGRASFHQTALRTALTLLALVAVGVICRDFAFPAKNAGMQRARDLRGGSGARPKAKAKSPASGPISAGRSRRRPTTSASRRFTCATSRSIRSGTRGASRCVGTASRPSVRYGAWSMSPALSPPTNRREKRGSRRWNAVFNSSAANATPLPSAAPTV